MKNDGNEGQAMTGVMVRKKEERRRIKTDEDRMKIKAFYYRGMQMGFLISKGCACKICCKCNLFY